MLEKQYLKTKKNECKVTFSLPATVQAENVFLVGDFNDWDQQAQPMRRNREGDWATTLDLEPGRQYEYRYRADERTWHNDPKADAYVRNPYGSQNLLVITSVASTDKASAQPKRANRKS